jgi:hypothetical protein
MSDWRANLQRQPGGAGGQRQISIAKKFGSLRIAKIC